MPQGEPMCSSVAGQGQAGVENPCGGSPPPSATDLGTQILARLDRIAAALESLSDASRRIAAHIAPEPGGVVGTPFLAERLGCTVVWAGEMARDGRVPKSCIVPGTGCGKPWKFYRMRIEDWLNKR